MRNTGNGVGIVSLLASAAAAGLLVILATVGLVLAAVFVLVFLGITLFVTRKRPLGQFSKFWVFGRPGNFGNLRDSGCKANRARNKDGPGSGACYDLSPEDYRSSRSPRKLRSGD